MTLITEYKKIAEEILPLDSRVMPSLSAIARIKQKKGARLLASYKERIKRLANKHNIMLPDCIRADVLPRSITKDGTKIPIIYAMSPKELPLLYRMFGNYTYLDDIAFALYCLECYSKRHEVSPPAIYLSEFYLAIPINN